jgi:hypothetical protein
MNPLMAMSCSRQARITVSLIPLVRASRALCSRWLAGAKRSLK